MANLRNNLMIVGKKSRRNKNTTYKKARLTKQKTLKGSGFWKNGMLKVKNLFSSNISLNEKDELFSAVKTNDVNKVKMIISKYSPRTLDKVIDSATKFSLLFVVANYAYLNNDDTILTMLLNKGLTITQEVKTYVEENPEDPNLNVLRNRMQ